MMRGWSGAYTESQDEARMAARLGRRLLQRQENRRADRLGRRALQEKEKRKRAGQAAALTGRCKTKTPGAVWRPGVFVSGNRQVCLCCLLVDVVLLPVEGGVGLDDYVFVRGLL
jgi:hypothetical protein